MVKKEAYPKRKSFLDSPEMAEAKKMVENYKAAMHELDKKIDEFQAKTGYSPNQVKAIFDNPNNFSANQWEAVKLGREKIFEVLNSFESALSPQKREQIQKLRNPPEKKRNTKTRGMRQNWIPMK